LIRFAGVPRTALRCIRATHGRNRPRGNATPDSAATAASSGLRGDVAAVPIPAKSIAALPFENLSDDKKNEYFVAGMLVVPAAHSSI
jgi:hypothetical protein